MVVYSLGWIGAVGFPFQFCLLMGYASPQVLLRLGPLAQMDLLLGTAIVKGLARFTSVTLGEGLLRVYAPQRCLGVCNHPSFAAAEGGRPSESKTLTRQGAAMLLREACRVCLKYLPACGYQLVSCTNQSLPALPGTPELLTTLTLNAREEGPLGLMSTFPLMMHPSEWPAK